MDAHSPRRRPRLPAAVLALLYTGLIAAPLAVAWATGIVPAAFWREAVSVTGLVGCMMLILQFVTSGRYEMLSGRVGIDVTMAFHKWAAQALLVVVIVHPLLLQMPALSAGVDVFFTRFWNSLGQPRYLTGTVALVLVILVTLLGILRQKLPVPYEVWRGSHLIMALAAVWLAVLHGIGVGTYSQAGALAVIWPALAALATALLLGVHAVKSFAMRRQGWRVVSNRKVARGLWEMTIAPDEGRRLDYAAGQFAWITFAPRRLLLLDHPFSIASSPAAGSSLIFLIKEVGDFTRHVGEIEPGRPVGIDAPHGSFMLEHIDADAVVLIAGGAGIAPVLGLLRDLAARKDKRPVRLLYATGYPASMIDPKDIEAIAAGLDFKAQFIVEDADTAWSYQRGVVGEAELDAALDGLDPRRTAVMICGPAGMTAAVADKAAALGVPLRLIHYERFDYGGGRRSRKDWAITASFFAMAAAILAIGTAFALRG